MKNLFNILAASLVTCLVLSSCGKVETPNNGTPGQKKEPRVISLAFASTRTTLGEDGYTPTFAVDDQIKISNGTGTDDCSVKYDATKGFYIETALEGPLTAVYPASAAEINGKNITGVLVPATQDGTFAKANICKAVQSGKDDELTFNNQTAILRFYVDESIGVTQLTISGTDVSSSGNSITVTPSPSSSSPKYGGPDDRICYVAISATASGTTYSTLTLTSVTTTQTAYADNTVTRKILGVTLKQNEMYNAFIPYYIEVGDQKWGYCNVGAFLPEEPGKYFAWGDTVGQTWTGSQFIEGGFEDIPYYVDVPAPEILPLEKDAANVIWGEDWRIPTVGECSILAALDPTCRSWKTDFHGATGWLVPNSGVLFFPATGFAPGLPYVQSEDSSYGYYYTRNSVSMDLGDDYILSFAFTFLVWHNLDEQKVTANDDPSTLDCGCSIRPIYVGGSSEPDEPDDDGMILIIDDYDDGWDPNSYPSE